MRPVGWIPWIAAALLLLSARPGAAQRANVTNLVFRVGDVMSSTSYTACEGLGGINQGLSFFITLLNNTQPMTLLDVNNVRYRILFNLTHYEDDCNATAHVNLVNQLLTTDAVDFYMASTAQWSSTDTPMLEAADRLCLYCCASPPSMFTAANVNTFGTFLPNTKYMQPSLKSMAFVDVTRVVVAYRTDDVFSSSTCLSGLTYVNVTLTNLRHDFEVVSIVNYTGPVSAEVMTLLTATVNDVQADAVAICGYAADAANLTTAVLAANRYLKALYVTGAPAAPSFVANFGKGSDYILSSTQFHAAMLYADNFFGTAENFNATFFAANLDATTFSISGAAGAAVTGYNLANAIQQAFTLCDISGAKGNVQQLLYNVSAIKCYTTVNFQATEVGCFCSFTELVVEAGKTVQVRGTLGYDLVRAALKGLTIDTFFGPIAFNSVRQNIGRDPAVTQIQGRSNKLVGPQEIANGLLILPIPPPVVRLRWIKTTTGKIIIALVVTLGTLAAGAFGAVLILWYRHNQAVLREMAPIMLADLDIKHRPIVPLTGRPENGSAMYRGAMVSLVPLVEALGAREQHERPFNMPLRRRGPSPQLRPGQGSLSEQGGGGRLHTRTVLSAAMAADGPGGQRYPDNPLEGSRAKMLIGQGSRSSHALSDVVLPRVDEDGETRRSLEFQTALAAATAAAAAAASNAGRPSRLGRSQTETSGSLRQMVAGFSADGAAGVPPRRGSDGAGGLGPSAGASGHNSVGVSSPQGSPQTREVFDLVTLGGGTDMWVGHAAAEHPLWSGHPTSATGAAVSLPLPAPLENYSEATLSDADASCTLPNCLPSIMSAPAAGTAAAAALSAAEAAAALRLKPHPSSKTTPRSSEGGAQQYNWGGWGGGGSTCSSPRGNGQNHHMGRGFSDSAERGSNAAGELAMSSWQSQGQGDQPPWILGTADAATSGHGEGRRSLQLPSAGSGAAAPPPSPPTHSGPRGSSTGELVLRRSFGAGSSGGGDAAAAAAADLLLSAAVRPPPHMSSKVWGGGSTATTPPPSPRASVADGSVLGEERSSNNFSREPRLSHNASVAAASSAPGLRLGGNSSIADLSDFQAGPPGRASLHIALGNSFPALGSHHSGMQEEPSREDEDLGCCSDPCSELGKFAARKLRRFKTSSSYQAPQQKDIAKLAWRLTHLHHPHVVPVLGVITEWPGFDVDTPVLVTEYCDFDSLALLLQNETLHLDMHKKADIAGQIAAGMRFLHAQVPPIVHAELSLHHIMLDRSMKAKLIVPLRAMRPVAAAAINGRGSVVSTRKGQSECSGKASQMTLPSPKLQPPRGAPLVPQHGEGIPSESSGAPPSPLLAALAARLQARGTSASASSVLSPPSDSIVPRLNTNLDGNPLGASSHYGSAFLSALDPGGEINEQQASGSRKSGRRFKRPKTHQIVAQMEDDVYDYGLLILALFAGMEQSSSFGTSRSSLGDISYNTDLMSRPLYILEDRLVQVAETSEALAELCAQCLEAEACDRPSFEQIALRLENEVWPTLRCAGNGPSALSVLGGGTGGLAGTVKGMTRNDDLLYELFPPKIARALQNGEEVQPEHYPCVSIMFSDIVGYTEICSQMPACEVVDLLHRLYTRFDHLIREMDVGLFKVETIGDAFIAAGNLRRPNPTGHARSLTEFAFMAIQTANETRVHASRPEMGYVNIRVGLHAGPVVGSVVGMLNKKFAIFGDAVNQASRMETMSLPNRVHCSKIFADLVRAQWPEISVQSRGPQQVKGKGVMETFWLSKQSQADILTAGGFLMDSTLEGSDATPAAHDQVQTSGRSAFREAAQPGSPAPVPSRALSAPRLNEAPIHSRLSQHSMGGNAR